MQLHRMRGTKSMNDNMSQLPLYLWWEKLMSSFFIKDSPNEKARIFEFMSRNFASLTNLSTSQHSINNLSSNCLFGDMQH